MKQSPDRELPSVAMLRSRLIGISTLVSVPAFAVMGYYLTALLAPSGDEWRWMVISTACFTLLVGGASLMLLRRWCAPVAAYLADHAAGEAGERAAREAFRNVMALPRNLQLLLLRAWTLGALLVAMTMWALGFEGWNLGLPFMALVVVAASCGLVSSTAFFFLAKRELEPLRDGLAAAIGDPEERGALIARMPLAKKVQAVVVGSVVASLGFSVAVAYTQARDAEDARAAAWQVRSLEMLEAQLRQQDFAEALESLLPEPALSPYEARFFELGATAGGSGQAEGEQWVRSFVARRVKAGEPSGLHNAVSDPEIVAWRSLAGGRVLIAAVDRASLPHVFRDLRGMLSVVLLMATGLCFAMAWLLTRDLRTTTDALAREAARLASGDLRRGATFESEDELGDLARAFEGMGASLRSTVGRVVEAADRVDGAAGQIAGVADSVSVASADQVRRIQQASELMLQINSQVTAVAGSAQALNESVEESSSSILELGAAGDELNETASVLSSRVDEVSTSIEEMVRSVKQVGANSEVLTDAALETSSSMEEMASAMRVVDTTAEATAELSRDVVTSAEKGQAKVSETIDGIGAIRDSTDVLEQVIEGLGARATEVGAILDVIDDVADETNLLALNAAIIAAQAGEHGRAFSVVADEIKELADRVLASTKEIGGLIRSVQAESSNAARAIEEGSRSVASGVERSAEAGTSLEEITRASRESGTRIGEILAAVREQTKAASHVVELMERVRGGVDQISAAGAEQDRGNEVVFRSSVAMREVAQQVRRTTDEQARGFVRIRESVEGVREAVEQINGSLQEQSSACGQVAEFLEQVYERTRSNEEAAQRMGQSMTDLVRQAEALREDVARFQT